MIQRKAWVHLIFVFYVSLFLSSCSFFQQLAGFVPTEPTVRVQKISVQKIQFPVMDIEVDVQIVNPNQFALEIADIQYRAKINEQVIASGAPQDKILVEKLGTKGIALPLSINMEKSFFILKELLVKHQIQDVEISGTATFVSSIHNWTINFRELRSIGKN